MPIPRDWKPENEITPQPPNWRAASNSTPAPSPALNPTSTGSGAATAHGPPVPPSGAKPPSGQSPAPPSLTATSAPNPAVAARVSASRKDGAQAWQDSEEYVQHLQNIRAGETGKPAPSSTAQPTPAVTDLSTTHAPPVQSPGASPAPEQSPAPRLSAAAAANAATGIAGVPPPQNGKEQGVTTASLKFTLPDTHCVRAGWNGVPKTPYKPRKKKPAAELRTHCVSVRLSDAELLRLKTDAAAQHKELADVLRDAYLNGPRPSVPPVNLEVWRELSRPLANLNQIAAHLNAGRMPEDARPLLAQLKDGILNLRAALLGQKGDK